MSAHRSRQDMALANQFVHSSTDAQVLETEIYGLCIGLTTAAAETRTLPAPFAAGLKVILSAIAITTSCTITVNEGINPADVSNTDVLIDANTEWCVLESRRGPDGLVWIVTASNCTFADP